jgi:hypothetical protein
MRRLTTRAKSVIFSITTGVLSLYFLMWAVQTAWLGSFPGRNLDYYTFWAVSQFSAAVIFGGVAVIAALRSRKTDKPSPREGNDV